MNHLTRRNFLKHSSAAGAAITLPAMWGTQSLFGQSRNGRPTIAAIGVGGSRGRYNQGRAIAHRAAEFGRMVAVCDVDDYHTAEFDDQFRRRLKKYRDYRKLLDEVKPDIVTIGTPDHWHVPIAIACLQAGCDVYCEKPLTLTIEEGFRIRKAVEESGKVFQVGTQQRSGHDLLFLKAIALVRSGRLGNNVNAKLAIGGAPEEGPFEASAVPEGLDWEMWVGPSPKAEYSQERRKYFRWYYEYSGGKMTDWGAHHIDIAQWALGLDHTGPVRVSGTGKLPSVVPADFDWDGFLDGEVNLPNAYNTATQFHMNLEFADGKTIGVHDNYKQGDTDFSNGILFEGDEGRIFVNRGRISGAPVEDLTVAEKKDLNAQIFELYNHRFPGDHMRNFFECVADRTQPIADVYTHHRTMTSCHLCNIALMLGRDLEWDPEKETFPNDEQAAALVARKSRNGFGVV